MSALTALAAGTPDAALPATDAPYACTAHPALTSEAALATHGPGGGRRPVGAAAAGRTRAALPAGATDPAHTDCAAVTNGSKESGRTTGPTGSGGATGSTDPTGRTLAGYTYTGPTGRADTTCPAAAADAADTPGTQHAAGAQQTRVGTTHTAGTTDTASETARPGDTGSGRTCAAAGPALTSGPARTPGEAEHRPIHTAGTADPAVTASHPDRAGTTRTAGPASTAEATEHPAGATGSPVTAGLPGRAHSACAAGPAVAEQTGRPAGPPGLTGRPGPAATAVSPQDPAGAARLSGSRRAAGAVTDQRAPQ